MNHIAEIIADPIIEDEEINPEGEELTQEEIDDLSELWEGEDPFAMCDECKRLGYCKRNFALEDSIIANMIPKDVEIEYFRHHGAYTKKHLQAAVDAFHEQDYETSILNCKVVIQENKDLSTPFLVIAFCQYFLGELAEALTQYKLYLANLEFTPKEDKFKYFIWHCENKLNSFIGQ